MKNKHNAGFSLIEVLVAIALLGIIVVPTCSGLLLSIRMNAKTEELMQSQLAVSSAVETLMAEGITTKGTDTSRFDDVTLKTTKVSGKPYYEVTVESGSVAVTTYIRENVGGGEAPENGGSSS